jgi:hypothetical protein
MGRKLLLDIQGGEKTFKRLALEVANDGMEDVHHEG